MTQSIPDSISSDDLQNLINQVSQKQEVNDNPDNNVLPCGKTANQIMEIADKYLNESYDEVRDIIIHKAMIALLCEKMVQYHTDMGLRFMREGEFEASMAWSRDAGKFQSLMNVLATIQLGPSDFLVTPDNKPSDDD